MTVSGDRTLLRRLVRNLVENARRYGGGEDGRGPVTVSVAQESNSAVLEVSDHGPGVPEAERQRIFEPFYHLAGGDAVCLATEGGGSRFRVELPAAL